MGKVKAYRNRFSRFLQSDNGQRFFNFAYSIGAAIVIWGALFKILHLPGGNFLLSLGMGTEVLMFVLSAFDRPPREYHWEKAFPSLDKDDDDQPAEADPQVTVGAAPAAAGSPATSTAAHTATAHTDGTADMTSCVAELTGATRQYLDQMTGIAAEMERLRETTAALNQVTDILLQSCRSITENSENITRSSTGYVEQMQDLNRNIGGLNTIYEIQLKSVSSQLDSIDRVNRGIKDIRDMYEKSSSQSQRYVEETEKMARNMQQLNSVYEKMLTAMTINMYRGAVDIPGVNDNDRR